MKNATINLYEFHELTQKAKDVAISEHRDFMLSIMTVEDFACGEEEYDTPGNLLAMYHEEYDYYLNNDEPIIESIEANGYIYFDNGEMADVTTYTGGPKAGTTELKFCGEVHKL